MSGGNGIISGVLLFEARPAPVAKTQLRKSRDEWKPITQNTVERFRYMPPCGADYELHSDPLPELLVDFRRYFYYNAN
jgi:hypothetical protein